MAGGRRLLRHLWFVIPYALHHASYSHVHYGRFLLKRVVRLDPPYIAAIGLALVLGYLSQRAPGFAGPPFRPTVAQVALHLGYVNVFFGHPWLNPVFWSLAIEFQYYLVVGLLFGLVADGRRAFRYASMAGFGSLAFVFPQQQFLCHYAFLFLLGIGTFQYRLGLVRVRAYTVLTIFLTLGAALCMGWVIAVVGLTTALTIAFLEVSARPLVFLGNISYSLYLTHAPIGSRVVNLWARATTAVPLRFLGLAVALAVSILAAWLLYRLVERPAREWSGSIHYGPFPLRGASALEPERA